MTSKSIGITREYAVATQLKPTKNQLLAITKGAYVDESDKVFVQPVAIAMDGAGGSDRIRIVVAEGSSRQVCPLACQVIAPAAYLFLSKWPPDFMLLIGDFQLRTLVESTGLRVNSVKRVRIGGYRMPNSLGIGSHIELEAHEVRRITDRGADASV